MTSAVVGVILNLAVWFAWQVWRPVAADGTASWDAFALLVTIIALLALHRFKANLIAVILLSGAAGVLWSLVAA